MSLSFLRVAAVAVSLAALCGCSKSPKDKLRGKWVGDRVDNVPEDQLARATGWVKGTIFEFAGDKMTVTIPAEQPRTGTFKVTKAEGQKLTLDVAAEGQPSSVAMLTMDGERTLHWDIGQGREILLVRAQ